MELSLKLINDGVIKLKGLKFSDKKEDENYIRFVPVAGGKVYLKILLDNSKFTIESKDSDIIEDDVSIFQKIEEWLVEYNPNNQFGTEKNEEDIDTDDEDTPYDPEDIRVDTKSFSLRQIFDMIKGNDIDLTPDFQRNLVWDPLRKSRLIESILLRIPLPMFYFAQDEDGKISVVDGLQRLSTIKQFMDNDFKLTNLEYLQEKCGGKYYRDEDNAKNAIDPKYFRWLNMTQIVVNVIDPSSPFKLKYDIFRRINTGGQPLNSQEIRNCLAGKELRDTLRQMAQLQSFKEATGWSVKDVRMEGQEMALRFILFFKKYNEDKLLNNYNGNIESELNTITESLSKNKKQDLSIYISLFDNAMKNAYHLFGDYSFRKSLLEHLETGARRQLINKALFVSWSVLLSKYDFETVKVINDYEGLAYALAEKITNDNDLYYKLTNGTNARANILSAFNAAEIIIETNLKS